MGSCHSGFRGTKRFCQPGIVFRTGRGRQGRSPQKGLGLDRQALHFWLRRARESYHCMIHRSIQNPFFEPRSFLSRLFPEMRGANARGNARQLRTDQALF